MEIWGKLYPGIKSSYYAEARVPDMLVSWVQSVFLGDNAICIYSAE